MSEKKIVCSDNITLRQMLNMLSRYGCKEIIRIEEDAQYPLVNIEYRC